MLKPLLIDPFPRLYKALKFSNLSRYIEFI
nr:MAG TPA: hypothetical protein [Caudoviricetes sp.]